ncbi:UDP-arabinose 4-epimerase [Trifolium repens]|nr:UDP-arabinose 4-epimerase [Trifolium repens]
MSIIAPVVRHPENFPFARMWCKVGNNYVKSPLHKVYDYRTRIDHMQEDNFTWRPYLLLNHQPQLAAQSWGMRLLI